ncbi:MAG: hypothetical protein EOP45_16540 [Sphingobacteriaceae bacterium]|nr:MAG: hypothetical protein EOP45_16540 [Sphingobacteriaceae bacterium]
MNYMDAILNRNVENMLKDVEHTTYLAANSCGGCDIAFDVPTSYTITEREDELRKQIRKTFKRGISRFDHDNQEIYLEDNWLCIIS